MKTDFDPKTGKNESFFAEGDEVATKRRAVKDGLASGLGNQRKRQSGELTAKPTPRR